MRSERSIDQNDEARDVVARDLLQPEPKPDTQRAAKHAQHRDIDAYQREADQHRRQHEHSTADARHDHFEVGVERGRANQAVFERRAQPHRDNHRHADPQKTRDQRQQRHMGIGDAEMHAAHPRDHVVLNAHHGEHHADPHDQRDDFLDEE
jgi:hypothetical protein